MNKFKLDIQKKNLSWENTHFKRCDSKKCSKKGEYKAPKSRVMLNDYYFFCLDHIKEYNKSWDFYKGMSVDQIEKSMRSDTIWDRPSWPLKGKYNNIFNDINEYIDEFGKIENGKINKFYFNNKLIDEKLTAEDLKSIKVLELSTPLSLEKVKKNYKKLVKIFHPDINGNNKKAEEKFKKINESYKLLLKKFVNNNGK